MERQSSLVTARIPTHGAGGQSAVEQAIYEALLKNRALDLLYQGRNDPEPKHLSLVHPLAVVYREPLIYLVCTMWDYREPRQILLHRVKAAQVLERECDAPPDFDLDRYINEGEFGFRIGPTIHLEAHFDAEAAAHLAETPISEDQKLTALPDGRVHVEASVPHTKELNWWLRGFGDLVEVISPALVQDSRLSLGSNTDVADPNPAAQRIRAKLPAAGVAHLEPKALYCESCLEPVFVMPYEKLPAGDAHGILGPESELFAVVRIIFAAVLPFLLQARTHFEMELWSYSDITKVEQLV